MQQRRRYSRQTLVLSNHAADIRCSLSDIEELIESLPHRPGRSDHNNTQQTKGSDTGSLLLLPDDRETPDQVITDPEGAMDEGSEKQPTASPTVDKV